MIVFRPPTTKSVLTTSVPFALSATDTSGWLWTPFAEFQRCEFRLTLNVLAGSIVTSILARPTLLSPVRGDRTFKDWKKASADAQLATGAVQAPVRNVALLGAVKMGKFRTC